MADNKKMVEAMTHSPFLILSVSLSFTEAAARDGGIGFSNTPKSGLSASSLRKKSHPIPYVISTQGTE